MASLSKVDVANKALVEHLAAKAIISFDDETAEARTVRQLWDTTRYEVQRLHPWGCLRTRAVVSRETSVAPPFEYDYGFPMPADYLTLVAVYLGEVQVWDGWTLENRVLLSNDEGPYQIKYIKVSDDPSEWDELLVAAVAAKLALAMAPKLNPDALPTIKALYDEAVAHAKRRSAKEQAEPPRRDGPWVRVRG